ncbi:MAG TPA: hypothetical protein DEB31_05465 [Clostridiales bacterium]|nr:hypothetical protein [Clostridiales bacterium]
MTRGKDRCNTKKWHAGKTAATHREDDGKEEYMKKLMLVPLNLRLFEGEGGEAGGDGAAQAESPAKVVYGKQNDAQAAEPKSESADEPQNAIADDVRKAEFEKLIKGDFKDLFHERTQKIIDARFKQTKQLEEREAALRPVLDLLGSKYGVNAADIEELSKAITADDSYYEAEATHKGLTVQQLKQVKALERENETLRQARKEIEDRRNAEQATAQWLAQAEQAKQVYANLDLNREAQDPETGDRFVRLLRSGVDVKTAYEVVHKDDIISGAMQHTANVVRQKTVNDIKSRGLRPDENGTASAMASAVVKSDVSKLTRKDREEISKRVMRGEKIQF